MRAKGGICVIVDKLMKLALVIAVNMQCSMETFAKLYVDKIVALHEHHLSIILDRDSIFVGRFWENLQEGLRTTLHFSSAYHL